MERNGMKDKGGRRVYRGGKTLPEACLIYMLPSISCIIGR